jgi:hypothetical protein
VGASPTRVSCPPGGAERSSPLLLCALARSGAGEKRAHPGACLVVVKRTENLLSLRTADEHVAVRNSPCPTDACGAGKSPYKAHNVRKTSHCASGPVFRDVDLRHHLCIDELTSLIASAAYGASGDCIAWKKEVTPGERLPIIVLPPAGSGWPVTSTTSSWSWQVYKQIRGCISRLIMKLASSGGAPLGPGVCACPWARWLPPRRAPGGGPGHPWPKASVCPAVNRQ